jgi:hypothetical protein
MAKPKKLWTALSLVVLISLVAALLSGFCSGTLSLSGRGRKAVSTFSVQGGSRETVLVPLPAAGGGRPTKLAATATTTQPLGAPITRKAILHLH